jgi:hypothetical protein
MLENSKNTNFPVEDLKVLTIFAKTRKFNRINNDRKMTGKPTNFVAKRQKCKQSTQFCGNLFVQKNLKKQLFAAKQ